MDRRKTSPTVGCAAGIREDDEKRGLSSFYLSPVCLDSITRYQQNTYQNVHSMA